ncbi:hypothetical protein GCM10023190_13020 [Enteractinococcus fodinae]|uniref:Uncharacterized protein n=1 Tax=Enteractinococcus fodinae TaxID=684663 RepID=A0ABU2AXZ0_9MICC|nr:hypothetical protein [Enteractinococcus fodinae]MDR7346220.1 hypothetical protein [Enteractinococcus fodinae]
MRLAIGAGFLAAIGLFAFGPASAAYATAESPDPSSSVVTEEPSAEETPGGQMSCDIIDTTDDAVTIESEHLETLEDLAVIEDDDEHVDFDRIDQTSIVVPRSETDLLVLVEGWDEQNRQRTYCEVAIPGIPEEPESETTEQPTNDGASPESSDEESPDETASPSPTVPPEPPSTTPQPTPSRSPSPNMASPTPPSAPAMTPSTPTTPQPPIASAPPTPYAPPPASTPSPSPTATTTPSEDLSAADTERRGPREIRPLAESPRYLLPEIFGMQSHRGSPLVMPGPRDADEQASELETLPPISEDELDAIKAQLSSPGHADRTPTGSQVESAAPQERDSGQRSWWLLGGLTSAVGIGAVLWWALNRYRRNH